MDTIREMLEAIEAFREQYWNSGYEIYELDKGLDELEEELLIDLSRIEGRLMGD